MNKSFAIKFLLAVALGLLTLFIIDPLDKTTVSTPFCLGIVLMGLSLRQSVPLVIAVSIVYSALSIYALVAFHAYVSGHYQTPPHPLFWLFQRSGLFLVLCLLAIYLAHYRTDTQRVLTRFRTILSKLPSPVIISDASGQITYINDAASTVLHEPAVAIIGKNYFDFAQTDAMKGQSIRSYFELFEADTNAVRELEVAPFGHNVRYQAQIISLGTGPNRIMITVLLVPDNGRAKGVSPSSGSPVSALVSGSQSV